MAVGVAGAPLVTVVLNVLAPLTPQLLFAVTEMVPPLVPATVVMDVVVELPVQPKGKVQV